MAHGLQRSECQHQSNNRVSTIPEDKVEDRRTSRGRCHRYPRSNTGPSDSGYLKDVTPPSERQPVINDGGDELLNADEIAWV